MTTTPAIECEGLSKRHGTTDAVVDVSLRVQPGELVALLGPSGCGKTSLLRLIAGFDRPDAGAIQLGGEVVVDGQSFVLPEKRRVVLVFQESALFPHLSVAKNIGYGLDRAERRDGRVDELLELVGLAACAKRHPSQLSGGEQQRIALARALAPRPRVILLDEPFAGVDAATEQAIFKLIERLVQEGKTLVVVNHDLSVLNRFDQVLLLNQRVVAFGATERVVTDENLRRTYGGRLTLLDRADAALRENRGRS